MIRRTNRTYGTKITVITIFMGRAVGTIWKDHKRSFKKNPRIVLIRGFEYFDRN